MRRRIRDDFGLRPARERVLIYGDEFYGILGAVRALRAAGCETWLGSSIDDGYANASAAVSGLVRLPDPSSEAFVPEIADAARRLAVSCVLPGTESSLSALSQGLPSFAGTVVGTPPAELVARAQDKPAVEELARSLGIDVPRTKETTARALVEHGVDVPLPVLLKRPRSYVPGESRQRPHLFFSPEDVVAFAREEPPGRHWRVQELVDGALVSVAGVAWHGEVVSALAQVADRVYPEVVGGGSYQRTIDLDPRLEARVSVLLSRLQWSGLYHVQLMRTPSRYYLIDFNPRVYGSIALATAAGHNLMEFWVDLLMGRQPSVPSYRRGVRYRADELDLRAIGAMARRGDLVAAATALLPRRNTTHAIFSLDDLRPVVLSSRKAKRRLAPRLARRGRGR